MLTVIALTVFLAALYFVRKWLMAEAKSVEADFEEVETEVQTKASEIKAKL